MLSVDGDVIQIIQAKFSSSETVKCIHLNVALADDFWNRDFHILAIVVSVCNSALFLFSSRKPHPVHLSDLRIESVIPIDEYFDCFSDTIQGDYNHLLFTVKYKTLKFVFKIEVGQESSDFASELIKSKEGSYCVSADYKWLFKYTDLYDCSDSTPFETQSLDISFIRQKMEQNQNSINRESMLKYQLKLKETEYIQHQEFTIFIGTWNVNGQLPTISLKPWLSCDEDPPDLYAVGFQEIDLSKEAFLFNDTPREAEWEKMKSQLNTSNYEDHIPQEYLKQPLIQNIYSNC